MTEQSPEVVATADISPVSPRPHYNTSPLVLPSIQDQAEQLDVNSIDQLTSKNPSTTMATEPGSADPALATTTDVVSAGAVAGVDDEQSLDDSIADDDSFDAYGEDANGEAQKNASDADNDDYARTFDSPAQGEAEETDQDVSKAGESMNSTSASDTLPHQSPVAPISGDASSPSVSHADGSLANPAPANPADTASLLQQHASAPPDTTLESAPAQPIHAQAEAPSSGDIDVKPDNSEPKYEDAEMEDDDTAVDIQKLVDDITANTAASPAQPPAAVPSSLQDPQSSPMSVNQSSLPPRPALTQEPSNPATSQPDQLQSLQPGSNVPPFSPSGVPVQAPMPQPTPYPVAAAPGTASAAQSLPPPPPSGYNATPPFASYPNNAQPYPGAAAGAPPTGAPHTEKTYNVQQAYNAFLEDERRYMSEAKWERFPDGSRIFIGNLSQERVSKKDVFDLFHQYGRLAQISLKSAYGFVQYHNVSDAQAAMENLQGAEIRGRKIHLEYSRAQKKKERDGSTDRKGGRDRNRGTDRYDGRDQAGRRSRDDYRPGRSPSPRRDDRRGRDDTYGRNARSYDSFEHGRGRSRSPDRFGRPGPDAAYRRRSPSPYGGRTRSDSERLDIPRRYGEEIPDVQLLLMQEVQRDFVDWVQRAFYDRGLKTNVMFLNPARAPREAVIQRQVLEGVHAVIELDMRAQSMGRIPLQVFDRSAGINNVRYDQYQDLEPTIAAELVVRTKGQAVHQQPPAYPPNPYGQPYAAPAPQGYPGHLPQRPPPSAAPPAQPDLASLVGQIDNNALQQLLASLQPGQQQALHAPAMPHSAHPPAMGNPAAVGANSQIDINALLGNLKNAAGTNGQPSSMQAGPDYGAAGYPQAPGGGMPPTGNGAMPGGADPSQQVATIMQQLARFRQ